MTIEEKAKQYAVNHNYNPYIDGDNEQHYTLGLEKGFMAGYTASKEETEWKTFETPPEFGRLIVRRNFYRNEFIYNVSVYENNDSIDRYLRNGYEWKYID